VGGTGAVRSDPAPAYNGDVDVGDLQARVARQIAAHQLIPAGGEVTCLVSGGADSTCLWHVLRELGYDARALHVDHGLRGAESAADAEHCRAVMSAEVVRVPPASTEAALRDLRYDVERDRLRATGHTASDQVETILYRLVSSGSTRGIRPRRADGVVRPLLTVWRDETRAYCDALGLPFRDDKSNASTKRGVLRDSVLPLLREIHPGADANLLALAQERPRLPRALERALVDLLSSTEGTRTADLGKGVRAVRSYETLRLEGALVWGPWTIEQAAPGKRSDLAVRSRRPGDRLAGRRKKVQDLFVDAKVPSCDRDDWPIVVAGDDVIAVPGIAEAPGFEGVVRWSRVG
jgi:tRNA(Ile)-lysidine synthetase-like protein